VTKAFLKALQQEHLAQATLVRIYATVRHFARWLHRKFPALFPLGCPTVGVKPPAEPTADWKGLTWLEELRLLNAVQTLRVRRGSGTDQGVRNHALLAALFSSGLRVSEVPNLERDQYTGKGFTRVQTKGGVIRDFGFCRKLAFSGFLWSISHCNTQPSSGILSQQLKFAAEPYIMALPSSSRRLWMPNYLGQLKGA
jgi:site-specific recombinase XerD